MSVIKSSGHATISSKIPPLDSQRMPLCTISLFTPTSSPPHPSHQASLPHRASSRKPYPRTPCAVTTPPIKAPAKPLVVTSCPVCHKPSMLEPGRRPSFTWEAGAAAPKLQPSRGLSHKSSELFGQASGMSSRDHSLSPGNLRYETFKPRPFRPSHRVSRWRMLQSIACSTV